MKLVNLISSLLAAPFVLGQASAAGAERALQEDQLGLLEIFVNGIIAQILPLSVELDGIGSIAITQLLFDDGLQENSGDDELGDISAGFSDLIQVNGQDVVTLQAQLLEIIFSGTVAGESLLNGVTIPTDGTNVDLRIDFFSQDFSFALPTAIAFGNQSYSCEDDFLELNLDLGSQSVIDTIEGALPFDVICTQIEGLLVSNLDVVTDNFLVAASQIEAVVFEDILVAAAAAESQADTQFPDSFEFFEADEFVDIGASLEGELAKIPLVDIVRESFGQFGQVLALGDPAILADALSQGLTVIVGFPITISAQQVIDNNLFQVLQELLPLFNGLFEGTAEIDDVIGGIINQLQLPLPSAEQFGLIVAALPPNLQALLSLGAEDIGAFLGEFGSFVTVADIADFFPNPEEVILALGGFGEAGIEVVIIGFLDTTVGQLIEGLGEDGIFIALILGEGLLATRIVDLIDEVVGVIIDIFDIEVAIPSRRLQSGGIDIGSLIEQLLGPLLGEFLATGFVLPVDPLGNVTITIDDFNIDLILNFITTNLGLISESAIGLPGVDLRNTAVSVDLTVGLGGALIPISLSATADFAAQLAPIVAFNYDNLIGFGFIEIVSLVAGLDVLTDFAECVVGSVAVDLRSLAHELDFSIEVDSPGFLDEIAVFFNEGVALFAPGVINGLNNFIPFSLPVLEMSELGSSCNGLSGNVRDNGEDDDEEDGIFGFVGLSDSVGFAIVGAIGVLLIIVVALVLGASKGKKKKKNLSPAEAENLEKAEAMADAKAAA